MKVRARMIAATGLAVLFGGFALAVPAGAAAPPITGTGTVSCVLAGKITFNPPLSNAGTATSETITIKANLNGCSGTGDGTTVTQGKVTGTITAASNDCSTLAASPLPTPTTTVVWKTMKGSPKLVNSTVAFTSASGGVNGAGKLQGTLTGSATAGSFAGDAASATAVISQSLKSLGNGCAAGTLAGVGIAASSSSASLS